MKRWLLALFLQIMLISLGFDIFGQSHVTAETLAELHQLDKDWKSSNKDKLNHLFTKYPLAFTDRGLCISFLAKIESGNQHIGLPEGINIGSKVGNILTLKVPIDSIHSIYRIEGIEMLELSRKLQPTIDRAVKDVRADSVHLGIGLERAYTGKNVIIGVTDWGFDYTHPMFMDTTLTNTRILGVWDQFRRAGSPPTGFNYGSEITSSSALASTQSDTACLYYDYATHGSHVAGIAGGSGAGIGLRGVAFESNFLFSQFYLDAASSIDAVNWMKNIAEKEEKRLVVNMSWGLYHLGPLDGTSLLSQALNTFAEEGVLIVTSGGNNGNVNFHLKKDFSADTLTSEIEYYSYSTNETNGGQSISAWGSANDTFLIGFEIYNGSLLVAKSPYYSTATTAAFIDSQLVSGSDTITFNLALDAAFPTNNSPHARLRIKNTNSNLKVVLKATALKGRVHFWNVTELTNGAGNWGMPFSSFMGSGQGDAEYGIGEPASTANVLTVAAHGSEVKLPNGSVNYGPLATFSSEGPTQDERVKPDLSAPGINVLSSISSFTTDSYNPSETLKFGGRTYHFAKFSGTSMASPATAGVAALVLEANPNLSPAKVKEILMKTAREDPKTGVLPANGSTEWGFGKVTANAALKEALALTGIVNPDHRSSFLVYPNPVINSLRLQFNETDQTRTLQVYSADGRLIDVAPATSESAIINAQEWNRGIYILQVRGSLGFESVKLIKE